MSKPASPKPAAKPTPKKAPDGPIGVSSLYKILKFGLYQYQTVRVDAVTGVETKVGPENVYGVVASDLVDLIFRDINPEYK